MTYELKEIDRKERATATYITYEVVNFDGNEEKLEEMVKELQKEDGWFANWSIEKNQEKRYLIKDVMHLD
jgi:hypothetical protein